ncbi:MAG TPA: GNAT family N-acetyltransferase [Pyrinomonadaceae bacterium]|nr:GNAT family N-acetyltransferase [Pyrinomonadaceae bacterium]
MEPILIRECVTIEELDNCVKLQRDIFGLPDLEISPRRHLIVSRQAGGWTLGAFAGERLVGFVHHLAAVNGKNEISGYSHMMAVARDYQNHGVGARLKWAQRERALAEGRSFVKWTWDPMQARNAHFNLNRLGVTAGSYAENFYGTDYVTDPDQQRGSNIDSDRVIASWDLRADRVMRLAAGSAPSPLPTPTPTLKISIPPDWAGLVKENPARARAEQLRVRAEFILAFSTGLICAGFERGQESPSYLLFERTNDFT